MSTTTDVVVLEPRYARAATIAYTLLRIVAGLLFVQHGAQKIFGAFGGFGPNGGTAPLASQFGMAGIIELVGGVLIAVGLFTRVAAFLASGEMAAAYFMAHFPRGFWPIQNQGELAVLYCFVFLYIAARGAGPWSVDGAWRGRALSTTTATRATVTSS